MRRFFLLLVFAAGIGAAANAQTFEEFKAKQRAEFGSFKAKTQKEFDEYREKTNAEFADFMRKPWEKKEGKDPVPEPVKSVPDIPPVVIPDDEIVDIPLDNEIPVIEIVPLEIEQPVPAPVAPIAYKPRPKEKSVQLSFYGTPCSVRFNMEKRVFLKDASENSAADMWQALSGEDYDNLLYDCMQVRSNMELCDWAYYQFADSVASAIYKSKSDKDKSFDNESVMLRSYIMSQSGFKIRLARSAANTLHLLVSIGDDLYNYKYWVIGDIHYYLTDKSEISSLYIFDREFPNEKAMRMSLSSAGKFAQKATGPRKLKSRRYPAAEVETSANKNLMDFYSNYPGAYKRNNTYSHWSFYANTPLSETAKSEIYPVLKEQIEGKSGQEAANIIINFVQTAFEYKTDNQAWGYERTFFPDETLYYPYSDCEDRAILFTRIIRDLLGYEAVLLYYPGHLACAVAFEPEVPGDYIVVGGKRYTICDPTYINANIGMTMPGNDNSQAIVIML